MPFDLIRDKGREGRRGYTLPKPDVESIELETILPKASLRGEDIDGDIKYDYLIYALGRRLATERVKGFFEHAHHLLGVKAALKFGEAARDFREGHAVVGSCPGARLEVPVYETAFALARQLEERGDAARITVISPESPGERPGGADLAREADAGGEAKSAA